MIRLHRQPVKVIFSFTIAGYMPRIEIWKSTPSWRTLSPDRQRTIIHRLTLALRTDGQNRLPEEEGPFLIEKKEGALLIWSSDLNPRHITGELDKFFEPLASTAVSGKLNARILASKMVE